MGGGSFHELHLTEARKTLDSLLFLRGMERRWRGVRSWLQAGPRDWFCCLLCPPHPPACLPCYCCQFSCVCHSQAQTLGSLPQNLHTLTIVCKKPHDWFVSHEASILIYKLSHTGSRKNWGVLVSNQDKGGNVLFLTWSLRASLDARWAQSWIVLEPWKAWAEDWQCVVLR